MKQTRFLIKVNDIYYGKENSLNNRIINPYCIDEMDLPYIILENGYKTKEGAMKAAKKIQHEKKCEVTIKGLIFEK